MLNSITAVTTEYQLNIENMLNKSKKDYAYTMLDIRTEDPNAVADAIKAIDGVIRVRVI